MGYIVRTVNCFQHVKEIVSLHNEVWKNSPGIIDLLASSTECFIAVRDKPGPVVGYAFLQKDRGRGFYELNDIAVNARERGKGCGSMLMAHMMATMDRIKLCARAGNREVLSFYWKLGFKEEGVFENYYDVGQDAVRMAWDRKDAVPPEPDFS